MRALLASLGLAVVLGGGTTAQRPAGQTLDDRALELVFLDVGQGDAILVKLGGQAVLVDAGRGDDIVQVLAEQGVDSLVAAIASHNHDDHIGGMDAVVADFPIGRYFANGRAPENNNARSIEEWLTRRAVPRPPVPWEPVHLGDATITVFPTPLDPGTASENNSSLGVLVQRGAFRALLTGDSEVEELNAWMKAGVIPTVDVLKAAHHGARNGVTPGWLDRARPKTVVISVGASNSFGHPDPWALRYYQADQRKVYRTDLDGTVTVTVDRAGRYQVKTTGPTPR